MHLILLAANKLFVNLSGQVQIYSDCLGALNKVTILADDHLPSGCKHSDTLKKIMVNCSKLSFNCMYLLVPAQKMTREATNNSRGQLSSTVAWILAPSKSSGDLKEIFSHHRVSFP